jgi:phenylacetate-CoA ligase
LYPSAIDNLVRSVPDISEYEVNIRRIAGMDDLTIKIEPLNGLGFEEIARALIHEFRNQFSIRVSVEQASSGSLPRYEFKARRYKRVD